MNKRQILSGGGLRLLPWLALAAALLLSVGAAAVYGEHNLDADMSSEMVLAGLLNEEGRLLTDSWYYSTELRVISAVPAFQLGLRVFPHDWHAARVLGVALLEALTAASFLFMARTLGMKESAVYAAAAMLTPFSLTYNYIFLHGGFYAGFSIVGFLLLGVFLRPSKKPALWLLLAALCIYAGLAGVRMPMMLGVPLLLVCLAEAFGALRRSESLREAAHSEETRYFAGVCVMLAGMCAGYLVNGRVLSRIYTYWSYEEMRIGAPDFQRFLQQADMLFRFFGFKQNTPYLSAGGALSLLGLALVTAVIALAAAFAARCRNRPAGERVFANLSVAGVALGISINALSMDKLYSDFAPAYYMIGIQCMIASAFFLLERMPCRMRGVRMFAMAALCGVFLLEGAGTVRNLTASETDYERTANYLTQNGYTQGYATFWGGNVLTEVSDGEIEVWALDSYRDGSLFPWLQKKDHFERDPQGKVFAVVRVADDRPETFEPYLLEEFYGMRVYGFESAQAFREALDEAIALDEFKSKPNPNVR